MVEKQTEKIKALEDMFQDFHDHFKERMFTIKNSIIENDISLEKSINEYGEYVEHAQLCLKHPVKIDRTMMTYIKTHLKGAMMKNELSLQIDKPLFLRKLDEVLYDNVRILPKGISVQTTEMGAPKVRELPELDFGLLF